MYPFPEKSSLFWHFLSDLFFSDAFIHQQVAAAKSLETVKESWYDQLTHVQTPLHIHSHSKWKAHWFICWCNTIIVICPILKVFLVGEAGQSCLLVLSLLQFLISYPKFHCHSPTFSDCTIIGIVRESSRCLKKLSSFTIWADWLNTVDLPPQTPDIGCGGHVIPGHVSAK